MPEAGSYANRRSDERYALELSGTAEPLYRRSLEMTYQDPALHGQDRFKVETINISRGGLMIAFDPEVSGGDVLRLAFSHPETREALEIEAQIMWLKRNSMPRLGRFLAGVSFRDRSVESIEKLMEYAVRIAPTPLS